MGQKHVGQNNNYSNRANNDEPEQPQVTLRDELGRTLDCVVEFSLKFSGQEYALLQPVDYPVEIFAIQAETEDEETLVPLDNTEIEAVFDTAKAILAEQNLTLQLTALAITVSGELPLFEDNDVITIELEDGEGYQEEDYLPLGYDFFHGETKYTIHMPLSPMLFVARLRPGHDPEVLSPQDFQHIQPLIEEHLEKHLVDWYADDEDDLD